MEKAKFIDVVKKYPILYDPNHEDYRNIPKKEKIWRNIGRQFYTSADNLKRKWKSLRDTYTKYMKRVNAEGVSKEWIWAEHMQFFWPFLYFNNTNNAASKDNNYVNKYTTYDEYENQNSDSSTALPVQDNEYIVSEGDYMDDDNQIMFLEGPPNTPPIPEVEIKKEDPSSYDDKHGVPLKRKCDSAQDITSSEYPKEKSIEPMFDEVDYILLAHAKTVKRFSAKRQAITKYKIAQIILEQELLHLQECPADNLPPKRQRYQSGESSD
ncbi:uncharacterized protein LOC142233072 isoform X1 [Haematobia irritans]|uniref:uncharacterized protein LOC142233072 isoform X1 n=1 Tax=Haematobia irritans TaxID=7368 RepID=UPI003F50391C